MPILPPKIADLYLANIVYLVTDPALLLDSYVSTSWIWKYFNVHFVVLVSIERCHLYWLRWFQVLSCCTSAILFGHCQSWLQLLVVRKTRTIAFVLYSMMASICRLDNEIYCRLAASILCNYGHVVLCSRLHVIPCALDWMNQAFVHSLRNTGLTQ